MASVTCETPRKMASSIAVAGILGYVSRLCMGLQESGQGFVGLLLLRWNHS